MLGSSCGGDGGTPPDAGNAPGGTPSEEVATGPLTASDRGVTADRIRIGVAVADVSEFVELDDPVPRFQSVADSVNAAGGVGGRLLELVPVTWPVLETSAFEAACAELVAAEVFAVLAFAVLADLRCFAGEAEILTISLLGLDADQVAGSEGRLLTVAPDPTGLLLDGISLLADNLVGATVALVESPDHPEESAELQAALGGVGADLAMVNRVTAPEPERLDAQFDRFAQQWVAEDVTHVVVPAAHAAAALGALQRAREPLITIVSSQIDVPTLAADDYDPATVAYIGVGPEPAADLVDRDAHGARECLALVGGATGQDMTVDPPAGGPGNAPSTLATCAAFDLFTTIALAAGPELTTESFLRAGYDLDPFPVTGTPSGSIAPGKAYAGNAVAVRYTYDPDVGQFVPFG